MGAISLNFYAFAAILLAGATVAWRLDFGPMKRAEARTRGGRRHWPSGSSMIDEEILSPETDDPIPPRALNMVLPIAVMVAMVPVGLWITGEGNFGAGVGSTSVLWAVLTALAVAWVLLPLPGRCLRRLADKTCVERRRWARASCSDSSSGARSRQRRDRAGHRSLRCAANGRRPPTPAVPAGHLPGLSRHLLCDRYELGYLRDHAPHSGPGGNDDTAPALSLRCRSSLRRDIRRSRLTYL